MTDSFQAGASGKGPVKRVQIAATVIRADGRREELGVISDSSRWWRFGLGRVLAARRIKRANKRRTG